ncbi:MAG: hypothetical protein IKE69_04690 [Thermoguttaceae bacterium]|nr:hypothetical protein [Thermoguttaceae bacterium]
MVIHEWFINLKSLFYRRKDKQRAMIETNDGGSFIENSGKESEEYLDVDSVSESEESDGIIDVTSLPTPEDAVSEQVSESEPGVASSDSSIAENKQTDEKTNEDISLAEAPSWGTELKCLMESLSHDFQRKIKYDATKQAQIDQLYRENTAYKEGQLEKFKKRLVLAVIDQIDDAEKLISHYEKQDTENPDDLQTKYQKLLRNYKELAESFRDMLLDQFDIVSWQSEPKTPFDPRCQRVLKKTPTDDPALDKTICESIRFGYRRGEAENSASLIRPEIINLYTLSPNHSNEIKQVEMESPLTESVKSAHSEEVSSPNQTILSKKEETAPDSTVEIS